jgi:type IV fimbrial biogenesis protein FimT
MTIRRRVLRTASHSRHPEFPLSVSSKFPPLSLPSMRGMKFKNRLTGLTMIELVTVMSIVAVLAAIAVPSFRYITQTNRIASEVNGLLGDLQYARAEAIKEGQTVSACVSNANGTSCATGADWENGWIVFSDVNGDGQVNGADTVLRVQSKFSGSDTFIANPAVGAITFNREGFAAGLVNGTLIKLLASPPSNASTRCLSVTLIGLMTIVPYDGVTCS